jgi:uncharacterized protein YjbJ (UPF0337 family)
VLSTFASSSRSIFEIFFLHFLRELPRGKGTEFRQRCFPDTRNTNTEDASMDWNRVEGNWKQLKGRVKEKWGKLTDDDLNVIQGHRDQLEGKIQERYGIAKDQVRRDVDDWYKAQPW